jgi:hypothetical protein
VCCGFFFSVVFFLSFSLPIVGLLN